MTSVNCPCIMSALGRRNKDRSQILCATLGPLNSFNCLPNRLQGDNINIDLLKYFLSLNFYGLGPLACSGLEPITKQSFKCLVGLLGRRDPYHGLNLHGKHDIENCELTYMPRMGFEHAIQFFRQSTVVTISDA